MVLAQTASQGHCLLRRDLLDGMVTARGELMSARKRPRRKKPGAGGVQGELGRMIGLSKPRVALLEKGASSPFNAVFLGGFKGTCTVQH